MSDLVLLLVEDEPQMRRFLRGSLAGTGHTLVEAPTGAEGLAAPGQATLDRPERAGQPESGLLGGGTLQQAEDQDVPQLGREPARHVSPLVGGGQPGGVFRTVRSVSCVITSPICW